MLGLDLREPLSAVSHAVGAMLALPGIWVLWRRASGDRARQCSLLIFGVSLLACYSASAAFHAVLGPTQTIVRFAVADRVGIYVLIAGTYTPLAWNLLGSSWRSVTLSLAWLAAAAGALMHLSVGLVPPWISTLLYLAMGWGSVLCLREVARRVPIREVRLVVVGGILYSAGAFINLARWPNVVPGVFGFHEIFHLFVLAGSLTHFVFVLRVVTPTKSPPVSLPVRAMGPPRPKFLNPPYRRNRVS
jgi:hemolysin III